MPEKIRREYSFHGLVQGVGFRYHAKYQAAALGLTGWVRNEYDGTVTMQVQGDRASIDQLITELQSDRYIDIDDFTVKTVQVEEGEYRFTVKHG